MRRIMTPRKFAAAAVVAVVFLLAAPAPAANLEVVPSITLEGGWDSNIFDSSTNEESDFLLQVRPRIVFSSNVAETTISLSGAVQFKRYLDQTEENENPSWEFGFDVAGPLRITPRFSLSPYVFFRETTDPWQRNQFVPPPEPGIPPTDQIVTGTTKERNYSAGLMMKYLVSPRVDYALGGGAQKREYLSDGTGRDLEDSRTFYGDTNFSYRFNPQFSSGMYINARYDTWSNSPDAQTYSGGLQARYEVAEHYTLGARAGVSYYQEDAGPTREKNDGWTPTASFSFGYTKHFFSASLTASTEPSGGGGFGVITDRFTVYWSLTNQFAERWWWDLSGSYQRNKPIDDPTDVKTETMWGGAGIRYTATKWASLFIRGNIYRQRTPAGVTGDIDRETVFMGVTISTNYIY